MHAPPPTQIRVCCSCDVNGNYNNSSLIPSSYGNKQMLKVIEFLYFKEGCYLLQNRAEQLEFQRFPSVVYAGWCNSKC